MEARNEVVLVREARKSYGTKKVLCGANMTVEQQTIYGLLGPSSCGKTTLLNCILGLKTLDSGSIDVKIKCSKEIGYMPQEPALLDNLTIEENGHFFGTFFGLGKCDIENKMDELVNILQLEHCRNQSVSTCSGGEKRRVSLVVALLHNPKLLVLDEPTVGIDCLLSERIWELLLGLSDAGKTIIITTHYIQEARHCKVIGLMRFGILLEENPPQVMMDSYQTSNLESIFLKVCQENDENYKKVLACPDVDQPAARKQSIKLYPENKWFDKDRFKALLNKNILWIRRNPFSAAELLFLPILLSTLYGFTMRKPEGLELGVFSSEIPDGYGLQYCEKETLMYYRELNCTLPKYLSCAFYDGLRDHKIKLTPYGNYEDIARDMERGKLRGSVEVPEDFSSSFIRKIADSSDVSSHVMDNSKITSRIDGSNPIIKFILMASLKATMDNLYSTITESCGLPKNYHIVPITINEPVYGQNNVEGFGQSALPGFVCAFGFYFTLIYTSTSIMSEKVLGLMGRYTAGGMTYIEIVTAHVVIQFVVMFLQTIIMLVNFYLIMGYVFYGSVVLTFLLSLTVDCVGISLGFMLTEIFDMPMTTAYAAVGFVVSLFNTGGMIWPQQGMHYLMKTIIPFTPVSSVTEAMTSIITRNFGMLHPKVSWGFISNVVWTLIFTICAFVLNKLNKMTLK